MARAIIRLSLESGDASIRTRNRVRNVLSDRGFSVGRPGAGTGSYEREGADVGDLVEALREMLEILDLPDAADVDHLWVYLGEPL